MVNPLEAEQQKRAAIQEKIDSLRNYEAESRATAAAKKESYQREIDRQREALKTQNSKERNNTRQLIAQYEGAKGRMFSQFNRQARREREGKEQTLRQAQAQLSLSTDRLRLLTRAQNKGTTFQEEKKLKQRAEAKSRAEEGGTLMQQALKELKAASKRPAPRNMADETAVYNSVSSDLLRAPPRQELPVSVPRVFRESDGAEVPASEAFGYTAPSSYFQPTGAKVVKPAFGPQLQGFSAPLPSKKSEVSSQIQAPIARYSAAPNNKWVPDFIEKPFKGLKQGFLTGLGSPASIFKNNPDIMDIRNTERSSLSGTLGFFAGVGALGYLSRNPLAPSRAVTATITKSSPAVARFGVGILAGVTQGQANRMVAEQFTIGLGTSQRTTNIVGGIAGAIGTQITGEASGRVLAQSIGGSSARYGTLLTNSRQARLTLSLASSAPAGAIEGFTESTLDQLNTGGRFSFGQAFKQAGGGASSTVLLGALRRVPKIGAPATFLADPTEPLGDIATSRLGVFGSENINIQSVTPTPAITFAGFNRIGVSGSSVTSTVEPKKSSFGEGAVRVKTPSKGLIVNSNVKVVSAKSSSFIKSFSPGVSSRSQSISSQIKPLVSSNTRTNNFIVPSLPRTNSPIGSNTPTATNPFIGSRITTRTPTVTTTTTPLVNVPTFTPQFRFPPLFFPGAPARSSSRGLMRGFSRSRGTRYAPGLASISLGIYGKPSKTGLFSGAEARPLIDFSKPKKKAKRKKKAKKKVKRRKK